MSKAQALIVDDEADILELLEITLARMNIRCSAAGDIAQAKRFLQQEQFDFCLTDMQLPDGNGIDLIRLIAAQLPDLPVAMITAHGNMDSAVEAMKAGAFDFVSKPVNLQVLRRLVESALKMRRTIAEQDDVTDRTDTGLLGQSVPVQNLRRLIAKLARSQAPVFISGESGTGKELAARLIHEQGPRSDGEFVAVNCGAIPHELMESELFGHKKGSFTGAVSDKQGLFQAADGGTLFLDEIADLPLSLQVKLLRAIQEKSVRPVGFQREIPVDVRIISATHKDVQEMAEQGSFRRDLFYRINVIELVIPPLRERPEDIPLLAEYFLSRIGSTHAGNKPHLASAAIQTLQEYPFFGNVRELENILERAVALCETDEIGPEDLYLPRGTTPAVATTIPDQPLEDYLGEIEKQAILEALEDSRWNRTAAAKKLGMTLRSLRYRLSKLGID